MASTETNTKPNYARYARILREEVEDDIKFFGDSPAEQRRLRKAKEFEAEMVKRFGPEG
jgi:hypothetical protein